jgi:hypothetical protein
MVSPASVRSSAYSSASPRRARANRREPVDDPERRFGKVAMFEDLHGSRWVPARFA